MLASRLLFIMDRGFDVSLKSQCLYRENRFLSDRTMVNVYINIKKNSDLFSLSKHQ